MGSARLQLAGGGEEEGKEEERTRFMHNKET
jgi:hypothetical protein